MALDGQIQSIDSIIAGELSTKESSKEKTTDKRPIVNSSIDYRPIGQGSTAVNGVLQQVKDQEAKKATAQKKLQDKVRNARLLLNAEIDESLNDWVMEGLVKQDFVPFFAKACHTIGLEKVNRLAINARNGTKNKSGLFYVSVKGSMNLHFKRQFNQQGSDDQPLQ